MKTPEDEAFDDLARRQGAWGGGFQAKRAMAADKQEPAQEPYCYVDPVHLAALNTHQSALVTLHKNPSGYASRGLHTTPPAQEPVMCPAGLDSQAGFCSIGSCDKCKEIEAVLAHPAQEPDWKDQYEKQKRRAEMWIAKYEKDIGLLERVKPIHAEPAQEPVARVNDDGFIVETGLTLAPGMLLYTAPPKRERVLFPTMLRKMWSGGEVQAWLDENVNKERNHG